MGRKDLRVERPKFYFDPDNPDWPEFIELRVTT